MTSRSKISKVDKKHLADYGYARVRDVAFDALQALWRKRKAEGTKQSDIAEALGRDRAWVSRSLRGPGNWTLRTFGELVEALDGEVEIIVHDLRDPPSAAANYDAYKDFDANGSSTKDGVSQEK